MNFRNIFYAILIVVHPIVAQQIEDYSSGKTKLVSIMSNDETGIAAYNKKNIKYAQTENLSADLNIPEIARFFGCKTHGGESYMTQTLQYPVNKFERDSVLARRQMIIEMLVENPQFQEAVGQLLETAKQSEQDVVALMSDIFKGRTCPELAGLQLIKQQNPNLYPIINFLHTNPTAATVSKVFGLIGLATTAFATQFLARETYNLAQAGLDYSGTALYTVYLGLVTGFTSYSTYKDYTSASEKRRKLHALNQLIQVAEKIESLCEQCELEPQFKMSAIDDPQALTLIKKLKHPRYQHKKTYTFMLPSVHTFLYELYEHEQHLAHIFACVAEMDAYYAIATKMIESQETNNKFCFVTCNDGEKPNINAKSFWNVLVKDAVASDIIENKQIVLTGPNAGGKTTAIRALLQNLVLAQTFGIAAAESFEATQFDVIHSYLNISDDILNGKSLFASELKRAQDIVQKIKSLEQGQTFFFALDELFTGTAAEDGEKCAYEFIKRIAEYDNVQFIYATHFHKLKELGYESAVCTNYKVDAPTKNSAGKLVYPFTLSKGANEVNVAMDLAKEANLFE